MGKKQMTLLAGFLVLIIAVAGVYFLFLAPKGEAGTKEISVIVVSGDEELVNTAISTEAEFLADVLIEEEIASGDVGEFGLFITEAGGVTADSSKEQWWGIKVNGEDAQYGASDLAVVSGDEYTLTLMTGY